MTLFLVGVTGTALAEFGISAGGSFNYKADFRSKAVVQPRATNPGADPATNPKEDRVYDDGYVLLDNIPGLPDLTRFYGYDDYSQVNDSAGTITMNSAQTTMDAQSSSGSQEEVQPAVEMYWQTDLTENDRWNFGIRTALRWQRVELDNRTLYSATLDTITDTYTYTGTILPHVGSGGGGIGMPSINDTPTRTTTSSAGPSIVVARNLDANLFAFDFGPTLSYNLSEKLRLTASVGGTVAWVHSEFSYEDGDFARGRDTEEDWLLGAYAGADLQYQIGERWGIFGGAAYTRLENFEQEVDGRSAELQFDDSYTLRVGIFIR